MCVCVVGGPLCCARRPPCPGVAAAGPSLWWPQAGAARSCRCASHATRSLRCSHFAPLRSHPRVRPPPSAGSWSRASPSRALRGTRRCSLHGLTPSAPPSARSRPACTLKRRRLHSTWAPCRWVGGRGERRRAGPWAGHRRGRRRAALPALRSTRRPVGRPAEPAGAGVRPQDGRRPEGERQAVPGGRPRGCAVLCLVGRGLSPGLVGGGCHSGCTNGPTPPAVASSACHTCPPFPPPHQHRSRRGRLPSCATLRA